jgi:polar amino acid transport system substrate-binding protein
MRKSLLLKSLALALVVGLVLLTLLSGCGKKETEEKEETSQVITLQEGKLLMGSDTTYPPFEYVEGGKTVGFDVDLATEIADRLHLQLQVISTVWDGIIPGLKSDKYDILMSAMTITEERSQQIDFSDPYIDSDQSIAVKSGSSIKSEEDLVGKVVGVQVDTTGQFTAEKMTGLKEIRKYETILAAFEDLKLGRIDAIVNDYPVNAYISLKQGGTEVVKVIKTDEKYGIGIKKGNDQLREAINRVLAEIKRDGTYDRIYEKWFGKKS